MVVSINRTGKQIHLFSRNNPNCRAVFEISDEYGYRHVHALEIENFDEINWHGIEFNGLLVKDNVLYKFVEWIGDFPFDGITIEEIGRIQG